MLAKTFSNGAGGYSGGCIDYLADGDRQIDPETGEIKEAQAEYDEEGNRLVTREGATLLSGDLELTQELINQASAKFKRGYTSGVLSFEEADISMSQKLEIMESFEEAIMPGMERNEYDIAWIEHTDKNRLELNWVIPRIHLPTGAHLQPYFHDIDSNRIKHWQEAQNAKYGYSSPDEPEKRHSLTFKADEPQDRKEIKSAIENLLDEANPKNRREVVAELNAVEGLEVVREVKKSISVKAEGHEKNIRLTGVYFEQDFNGDRETTERIGAEQKRFTEQAENRHEYHDREYRSRLQKAGARNREKYDRIARNLAERDRKRAEEERENAYVDYSHDDFAIDRSDGFDSNEPAITAAIEDPTGQADLHGKTDKFNLPSEQEADRRISPTKQKIASIFNEQRANNQADNRNRNRTFEEYAEKSAGINRQSTGTNRRNARGARDYARELKQTIERISRQAGEWAKKRYEAMRGAVTKKPITANRDKGQGWER